MSDRVLITGGAGFIGCRLAVRLLQAGAHVVVADNLHPQIHRGGALPTDLPAAAQFVPFDVSTSSSWGALLQLARPNKIVHLAAETGTGQSLTAAGRHAAVNVLGCAELTDALAQAKLQPEMVVVASSRAIYGDGAWRDSAEQIFYPGGRSAAQLQAQQWDHLGADGAAATPLAHVAGRTEPRPISVYGATKLAQEHMLQAWCTAFATPLRILRLQNVYGPGQALHNPYTGVLSLFARLALQHQTIEVFEDGHIGRDFVYIDDVVASLQLALQVPGRGIELCDIGSGAPTTILAVARLLAQRCEAPAPRLSGAYRHGDVRSAACSIRAAAALLGYRPAVSLEAGLQQLVGWVAAQPRQAA